MQLQIKIFKGKVNSGTTLELEEEVNTWLKSLDDKRTIVSTHQSFQEGPGGGSLRSSLVISIFYR